MNKFIALAQEPSTWRGAVMLLTAIGVSLSPAQIDSIIACGLAISGCIGVFFND